MENLSFRQNRPVEPVIVISGKKKRRDLAVIPFNSFWQNRQITSACETSQYLQLSWKVKTLIKVSLMLLCLRNTAFLIQFIQFVHKNQEAVKHCLVSLADHQSNESISPILKIGIFSDFPKILIFARSKERILEVRIINIHQINKKFYTDLS